MSIGGIGRIERRPADHARDKRRSCREIEQPARFGERRRRLHENRRIDRAAREDGREIGRPEVAMDDAECGSEPAVIAPIDAPEVLVRVDGPGGCRTLRGSIAGS